MESQPQNPEFRNNPMSDVYRLNIGNDRLELSQSEKSRSGPY